MARAGFDEPLDPSEFYPVSAVIYNLKPEFVEAGIENLISEHKEYGKKFDRLISSQVINLENARGVVSMFVGLSVDDGEALEAEIKEFAAQDPYFLKDMVDHWHVEDLGPQTEDQEMPEEILAKQSSK